MPLVEGETFADYEILSKIGQGGMGAVHCARQSRLKRLVALKTLPAHLAENAEFITRFQSEAIAAGGLSHPNLVSVHAAGEAEGIHYIAMEFIEGPTARQYLDSHRQLAPTEALDIVYHVAVALQFAWDNARLIHRDVKPDNIFLARDGTVKLGDFGLAKSLGAPSSALTLTGVTMGSPHYASPEQVQGRKDLDFRADIYSLGCTLFHLLAGRPVFAGEQGIAVMFKHVNDPAPRFEEVLPDAPAALSALVDRMLAKEPEERHRSHAELIAGILQTREAVLAGAPSARQLRRRRRTLWYVAAALVVGLIAAGVWWYPSFGRNAVSRTTPTGLQLQIEDFALRLRQLPTDDRVNRVMEKLEELNPDFLGDPRYTVQNGRIVELELQAQDLTNCWPIASLTGLQKLALTGDPTNRVRSPLRDLRPLQHLQLEELDISWTSVSDLSHLHSMPLTVLNCRGTAVSNLAAILSLKLTRLHIDQTPVTDLAPLRNLPLQELWADLPNDRPPRLASLPRTLRTLNDRSVGGRMPEEPGRGKPFGPPSRP